MTLPALQLDVGVVTLWDDNALDALFEAYWTAGEATRFLVLNDSEAQPGQPWPYCVFDTPKSIVESRSSGSLAGQTLEYRETPLVFNVHANNTALATGKSIGATLLDEILKIFGGHATVVPKDIVLTDGSVYNCQHQSTHGIRTGQEEYQWVVEYSIKSDSPVMVT